MEIITQVEIKLQNDDSNPFNLELIRTHTIGPNEYSRKNQVSVIPQLHSFHSAYSDYSDNRNISDLDNTNSSTKTIQIDDSQTAVTHNIDRYNLSLEI